MSATPIDIRTTPDLAAISWQGRNETPVELIIKNHDSRTIKQSRLLVVRADFLPSGSKPGESASVLWSAGESVIANAWLEARVDGGAWTALDDETGLDMGEFTPDAEKLIEIRLVLPDELPSQAPASFALAFEVTEALPPAVPLYYNNFASESAFAFPTGFDLLIDGGNPTYQYLVPIDDDAKGFRLYAAPNGETAYAARSVSEFLPLPDKLVLDCRVLANVGGYPGFVGLAAPRGGSPVYRIASAEFVSERIKAAVAGDAYTAPIDCGEYEPSEWVRITLVCDIALRKYDLYVNQVLAASAIDMHPTAEITDLAFVASGSSIGDPEYSITVADIGLFDGETYAPEQIWSYQP